MKKFVYKMRFSPYSNSLKAKNYKHAWLVLKKTYPEYNVKKGAEYLNYA